MTDPPNDTRPLNEDDPVTAAVLICLDAGFEIDDLDWQQVSDYRRYLNERLR